jgi:hypothetical protein
MLRDCSAIQRCKYLVQFEARIRPPYIGAAAKQTRSPSTIFAPLCTPDFHTVSIFDHLQ